MGRPPGSVLSGFTLSGVGTLSHPIAKVSKLAGHASVQITIDRYGYLAAEDLVDMADDIAA